MGGEANKFAGPLHEHLEGVAAYPPGKPIEEVQREHGLSDVVKLASNENPCGPSPKAVEAMKRTAGEMHFYPEGSGYYLKHALAEKHAVDPSEIVLGNGSDEITLFLAMCYLGPGRSIVTSNYSFIRYLMAAKLMNGDVKLAPMVNFHHDLDALAGQVDETTKIIFIDNPCNPIGTMVKANQLKKFIENISSDILIVIDEAYYEFACADPDYPDTLNWRAEHPNLMITRTFSKAYGLAGLRIGYGIASAGVIDHLERVRPPFNTNRMSQAAALAALEDTPHLEKTLETNRAGLEFLQARFDELGIGHVPSHANFILADFSDKVESGKQLYEKLLAEGVIVRPMAGYGLTDHVRISIGTQHENEKLVQALKKVLG